MLGRLVNPGLGVGNMTIFVKDKLLVFGFGGTYFPLGKCWCSKTCLSQKNRKSWIQSMVSNQFAMPGGLFIEEEGPCLKLMIPMGKAALLDLHAAQRQAGPPESDC